MPDEGLRMSQELLFVGCQLTDSVLVVRRFITETESGYWKTRLLLDSVRVLLLLCCCFFLHEEASMRDTHKSAAMHTSRPLSPGLSLERYVNISGTIEITDNLTANILPILQNITLP